MSTSTSLAEIIEREMSGLVSLSSKQLDRLTAHYELLLKWNQKTNLTTVTELPEVATRHYCESLFLGKWLTSGRVADVGSGAGFPGIPAAILRDDCEFDLIESHQRKAVFLKEASRGLVNVRVRSERAEAVTDRYDWLVARAVELDSLLKLRLAERFALLIGLNDATSLKASTVHLLPWGSARALAIVSRETTT